MCPKSPMDLLDKVTFGGVKEIAVGWNTLTLCSLLGTLVQSAQVLLMSAGEVHTCRVTDMHAAWTDGHNPTDRHLDPSTLHAIPWHGAWGHHQRATRRPWYHS